MTPPQRYSERAQQVKGPGRGSQLPSETPPGTGRDGGGGGGPDGRGLDRRGRTFLGVMQLQLLLVVPAQSTFVLSVCLHTEFPSKPFHVVCMNDRPQSGVNGQLG